MGFIANQPSLPQTPAGVVVNLPPGMAPNEAIANEPFWPLIDTAAVRDTARLDGTTTAPRLREALIAAMRHVNGELRTWAALQQAQGAATLSDVPAPQIGGISTKVGDYLRAITAGAQAFLEEDNRDQATMPAGLGKEQRVLSAVATREGTHWRNMRWAIASVMEAQAATVRVI